MEAADFYYENPLNFHHTSGRHTQGCSILLSHRRPKLRSPSWSEGFLEPNCEEIYGDSYFVPWNNFPNFPVA
jgi:hypothetical protein